VLFERIAHRLILTPISLELLEHVRAMGEEANLLSLTSSGQPHLLEGLASEVYAVFDGRFTESKLYQF